MCLIPTNIPEVLRNAEFVLNSLDSLCALTYKSNLHYKEEVF